MKLEKLLEEWILFN